MGHVRGRRHWPHCICLAWKLRHRRPGRADTSDDDTYPPEPPLVLTATEQAAAEEIFRNIKRASQESWRTEDWSTFAKLYPEGTFDCWNTPDEPQTYGFLSMRGIPESATYEMHTMGLYFYGGVDTSHMEPTHWMDVRYEHSYPSRCELPRAARWPSHHFYLRRHNGGFVLEHPCPDRNDPATRRMQVQQPVPSYARARQVVAQMSPAEDRELRQMFSSWPLAGTWSGLPNAEVSRRYGLSFEEADMVLELMCSTTGVPANAPGMSRDRTDYP